MLFFFSCEVYSTVQEIFDGTCIDIFGGIILYIYIYIYIYIYRVKYCVSYSCDENDLIFVMHLKILGILLYYFCHIIILYTSLKLV
jgi:hypothetical protein